MTLLNLKTTDKANKDDEYYTPDYALDYIFTWILTNTEYRKFYEPFPGTNNIVKYIQKQGFECQTSNKDFFEIDTVPEDTLIITNPPYSLKDKILERCDTFYLSAMLLLPLTALEGKKRSSMYRRNGVDVFVPNKRINFAHNTKNTKSGAWFATAWFFIDWAHKHPLAPSSLKFYEIEDTNVKNR